MFHALTKLLSLDGIDHAMLIGSDIPGLNADLIIEARHLLEKADLVLGPTEDGGYYLVGLNKLTSELFYDMGWGTDTVFDQTVDRAQQMNLRVELLPRLRDLDTVDDLKHFKEYDPIIS
jgi:glycosyltransferase A (GT-A) superfamily protein (DUF2064 family)